MTADATLQRVADLVLIRELQSRYCRAVDRRDEAVLREVFHPQAHVDKGDGPVPVDLYLVDVARRHAGIPMSSHQITNVVVDFLPSGDAFTESYGLAWERRHDGRGGFVDHSLRVRYGDLLTRHEGEWRVLERRVVIDQVTSSPATATSDFDVRGRFFGTRDAEDPVVRMRHEEEEHASSGTRAL